MNFSKKEKRLLALLGIVVLFAVYFNFFFYPQLNKINTLKKEINDLSASIQVNETYKKEVEGMDKELKIISQKFRDLRAKYPPYMNYDEVLITLKNLLTDSGIKVDTLTFSDPAEVQVGETAPKELPNAASGGKSEGAAKAGGDNQLVAQAIKSVTVSDKKLRQFVDALGIEEDAYETGKDGKLKKARAFIPNGKLYSLPVMAVVNGTNEQLKRFIIRIEQMGNIALIRNIQISGEQGEVLKAGMTIELYGIMDRNAGDYTLLGEGKWVPADSADKDNIFTPYEGYPKTTAFNSTVDELLKAISRENVDGGKQEKEEKYDFDMSLRPFGDNMTPPTVSISGRSYVPGTNAGRAPIIYGDNKGEEKVELYIEEQQGRFMFKFKTQSEAFPSKDYAELCELKPSGEDLKLLVVSSDRTGIEDKSGAVLDIINKTSKKLVVEVEKEDKNNPRLTINKKTDNIKIKYGN